MRLDGLAIGQSARWHEGRLWFANWGTGEIVAVAPDGGDPRVMVQLPAQTLPISFDWLPDGRTARPRPVAAADIVFGNGMAITPDGGTLIVAESWARRLSAFTITDDGGLVERRVWADCGTEPPDGICVDAEGAVWYADVPNRRCVRVREGDAELATVALDRGGFSCMLGGADGRTLFVLAAEWRGFEGMDPAARTGQLLAAGPAPAAHAGWP